MRRRLGVLVLLLALTLPAAGCGSGPSGAPKARVSDGLSVLAESSGTGADARLALHTQHGDVTFWGGVNVGSTTPGHNPGELSVPAEDYRSWFPQMAEMGVRFVRVYPILPPHFYDELLAYNNDNADAPLYLIQGVYPPDETYVETGDLALPETTQAFDAEIADASAAVSGELVREPMLGRASGTWTSDVTPWLAAWIVGSELDPFGVSRTDQTHAGAEPYTGQYFRAVAGETPVTPTESWIAERLDRLATQEVARGRSLPVAFVNWPTTDPFDHPVEANPSEDLVRIDANHILPTSAWPGGSFASYHAYPYYPDFMRFEPALQQPRADGSIDPYLTYLEQLTEHHGRSGLPTMITEFGVPSSLGSAHYGTNGRDQGGHTEQAASVINAQLMRGIKESGLAGALLFVWSEQWFKFTWNTLPRTNVVDSERRALWHDALNNEPWFGVVASDPVPTGWRTPLEAADGPVRRVAINTDAAYAYLDIDLGEVPTRPFMLGFDVVAGGAALPGPTSGGLPVADVAVLVDPEAGTAQALVRSAVNPIQLDGLDPATLPPADYGAWALQRLSANRAVPSTGGLPARPAEFDEIGRLVAGTWDPEDGDYDSMATWTLDDASLRLRLPWGMLLIGDPSSKTAVLVQDGIALGQRIESIGVTLDLGSGPIPLPGLAWDEWNQVPTTPRVKAGSDDIADAWHEVSADQ